MMEKEARKGRRDPSKETFWRETMREAEASGLSRRDFCRERGLKENLFYSWRRELKLRDAEGEKESGFMELVTRVGGDGNSGVSLRVGNGLSIVVERGFDPETLKAALGAVSGDKRT